MLLTAYGHQNIRGTHSTTIEVTTEDYLTKRGNCIIGVRASHSLSDLRETLFLLKGSHIKVTFSIKGEKGNEEKDEVMGFVHPSLEFTDTRAIIIRKSSFLCPRTLLVQSTKGAVDLNRQLIEKMKNPHQKMVIEINAF
ncbi:MAG: DUF371 domain-containing protein [Theionarchaea archaeon]|nr:DUF371 domain-containing protein [Theionarchaea archaeon]